MKPIDPEKFIGKKYHYWTVIGPGEIKPGGRHLLAKCKCGVVKLVLAWKLKDGKSKSCGCMKNQMISQKMTRKKTSDIEAEVKPDHRKEISDLRTALIDIIEVSNEPRIKIIAHQALAPKEVTSE